jgi:O-acetyl-ADP-ribose deacetylase (regulator of RNase III)
MWEHFGVSLEWVLNGDWNPKSWLKKKRGLLAFVHTTNHNAANAARLFFFFFFFLLLHASIIAIMIGSSLTSLATFRLGKNISLFICRGSVLDFACPNQVGAIVNAANEECLGGGGVDGAITNAGGPNLANDRLRLEMNEDGVRCPTGQARLTGPGDYGALNVPYVIHAVGPSYFSYRNFREPDQLVRSAYQSTLECCCLQAQDDSPAIQQVAFSLLSAGVFRGKQSLHTVLKIGVVAIRDFVEEAEDCGSLEAIILFAFSAKEADALLEVCVQELLWMLQK